MKGDTPTSSGTLKPLLTTEVKGIRSCSSRSMTLELLMEALLLSRVMVPFLSPSSKTGTVRSHGLSQWEQGRLPWEGHVIELVPGVCELQECCSWARSKYVLPLRPLYSTLVLPLCSHFTDLWYLLASRSFEFLMTIDNEQTRKVMGHESPCGSCQCSEQRQMVWPHQSGEWCEVSGVKEMPPGICEGTWRGIYVVTGQECCVIKEELTLSDSYESS